MVSYIAINDSVFLKYFIPQTWFAGRIFLSAMLVMTIGKFSTLSLSSIKEGKSYEQKSEGQKEDVQRQRRQQQQPNKLQKTMIIYLTIVVILYVNTIL